MYLPFFYAFLYNKTEGEIGMIWLIIGMIAWAGILVANWFIVMGKNPRKWKGGKKDE